MASNPIYLLETCAKQPIKNPIISNTELAAVGIARIGQDVVLSKSPELALILSIMLALSPQQKALVRNNLDALTRIGSIDACAALQVVGEAI